MGGLVSLAFSGTSLGLLQSWHYGSRAEKLTRLSYELDFQGLRLDVLSTIREEIRDQVFVIMSSLDNLMVVATLMLTLGFGFVVEGTFPPKSAEALANWEIASIGLSVDPLVVYAFLCAMSLVCPFWCLIFTIRMRYEVDLIVRDHMKELKRQLCNVLQKQAMQAPPDEAAAPAVLHDFSSPLPRPSLQAIACPRRLRRVMAACPVRRQEDIEEAATRIASTVADHVGPTGISSEMRSTIEQAQILKWAEKDLLQRMTTYRFYVKAAHLLLWGGMLCAIFTCSILLGLYMMEQFPNTPLVWITYSHIVGSNGGLAILFAVWVWWSSVNPVAASTGSDKRHVGVKRDTITRNSSIASISCSSPLLENSANIFSCSSKADLNSSAASSPTSSEPQVIFRVRDASSGLDAFRQVSFPVCAGPAGLIPTADIARLERLICAKFHTRRGGGGKAVSVKYLVRLRDRLEIIDDEDVAQLLQGDELEAHFTSA